MTTGSHTSPFSPCVKSGASCPMRHLWRRRRQGDRVKRKPSSQLTLVIRISQPQMTTQPPFATIDCRRRRFWAIAPWFELRPWDAKKGAQRLESVGTREGKASWLSVRVLVESTSIAVSWKWRSWKTGILGEQKGAVVVPVGMVRWS